jgi:hypothetical protein
MSHLAKSFAASSSARPRERGLKPERGAGSAVAAKRSGAALIIERPESAAHSLWCGSGLGDSDLAVAGMSCCGSCRPG